jgi:hypothetical protein
VAERSIDFSSRVPAGWFPCGLTSDERIRWRFLGNQKFDDSFFDETIAGRLHLEENRECPKVFSSLKEFHRLGTIGNSSKPAAFIFHISRCGSTLLSQLLSIDPSHVVLSEVPLLDQLLRSEMKNKSGFSRAELFEAGLLLLSEKKSASEKKVFVKLDSWHLFYHQLLRSHFPGVPFILLYREPGPVFRSHRLRHGMHMIPGLMDPALFGFGETELKYDLQDYTVAVLTRYLREFVRITNSDSLAFPVNYSEGVFSAAERLMRMTGEKASEDIRRQMEERAKFHSKYPGQEFKGDAQAENNMPPMEDALAYYRELEKIRESNFLLLNSRK